MRIRSNRLFAALGLFFLAAAAASAQLSYMSNHWQRFDRGITVGTNAFTDEIGTIVFDSAMSSLLYSDGISWHSLGAGGGGGSVTNVGYGLLAADATNSLRIDPSVVVSLPEDERVPGAALAWNSSGTAFETAWWAARAAKDDVDYAPLLGTTNVLRKGQLIHSTLGVAVGSVYQAEVDIPMLDKTDLNWLPLAVGASNYWSPFVERPAPGAQGVPGENGIGNLLFGPWQPSIAYEYGTNPYVVVEHGGKWWRLVATNGSTGESPAEFPSVWTTSVDRGEPGEITVVSNLVDRGTWSASVQYSTNDSVVFAGNRFYVGATNEQPVLGVPPPLDSDDVGYTTNWWTLDSARGRRGLTGPSGEATQYLQYFVWTLMDTNSTVFDDAPSASSPSIKYSSTSGGTNHFEFVDYAAAGTSRISVASGALVVDGRTVEEHALGAGSDDAYPGVAGEAVSNLAFRLRSGLRAPLPAVFAGGQATIHPQSNAFWGLDVGQSACTNVSVDVSGAEPGDAIVVLLEVKRGTNEWGWGGLQFLGQMNSVPTNSSTPFLLYRTAYSSNFTVW